MLNYLTLFLVISCNLFLLFSFNDCLSMLVTWLLCEALWIALCLNGAIWMNLPGLTCKCEANGPYTNWWVLCDICLLALSHFWSLTSCKTTVTGLYLRCFVLPAIRPECTGKTGVHQIHPPEGLEHREEQAFVNPGPSSIIRSLYKVD